MKLFKTKTKKEKKNGFLESTGLSTGRTQCITPHTTHTPRALPASAHTASTARCAHNMESEGPHYFAVRRAAAVSYARITRGDATSSKMHSQRFRRGQSILSPVGFLQSTGYVIAAASRKCMDCCMLMMIVDLRSTEQVPPRTNANMARHGA